jgi:hypothetical protein
MVHWVYGRGRIIHHNEVVLKQYLWASKELLTLPFSEILHRGDPLQASWYVWLNYYHDRDAAEASQYIDQIIEHWKLKENPRLSYRYAHNGLKPGWWSSMDMLLLPMALVDIGRDTNNEEYMQLANAMLLRAIESPEVGGSLWPDLGEGCWFSEYSWEGMTRDDEYYVLNGHLFSLTALKLIADALSSEKLQEHYDCAVKGTKALAPRFLNGVGWPSYMLTPKTINPPHYLLYEGIQLEGLFALTKDMFFDDQHILRSEIFERNYPVYHIVAENSLFFSAIGAPHPYRADIFDIEVKCSDSSRSYELKNSLATRDVDKFFYRASNVSADAKKCDVFSKYMNLRFKLYAAGDAVKLAEYRLLDVHYDLSASLDAAVEDGSDISIDPARQHSPPGQHAYWDDEGRVTLSFASNELPLTGLVALDVYTDSKIPIGITLHNGEEKIMRYFPSPMEGRRNLIVLSRQGFDSAERIDSVDAITVTGYTHALTRKALLRVYGLYFLANQYELYRLLDKGESSPILE